MIGNFVSTARAAPWPTLRAINGEQAPLFPRRCRARIAPQERT